jgi:hypothetical protein
VPVSDALGVNPDQIFIRQTSSHLQTIVPDASSVRALSTDGTTFVFKRPIFAAWFSELFQNLPVPLNRGCHNKTALFYRLVSDRWEALPDSFPRKHKTIGDARTYFRGCSAFARFFLVFVRNYNILDDTSPLLKGTCIVLCLKVNFPGHAEFVPLGRRRIVAELVTQFLATQPLQDVPPTAEFRCGGRVVSPDSFLDVLEDDALELRMPEIARPSIRFVSQRTPVNARPIFRFVRKESPASAPPLVQPDSQKLPVVLTFRFRERVVKFNLATPMRVMDIERQLSERIGQMVEIDRTRVAVITNMILTNTLSENEIPLVPQSSQFLHIRVRSATESNESYHQFVRGTTIGEVKAVLFPEHSLKRVTLSLNGIELNNMSEIDEFATPDAVFVADFLSTRRYRVQVDGRVCEVEIGADEVDPSVTLAKLGLPPTTRLTLLGAPLTKIPKSRRFPIVVHSPANQTGSVAVDGEEEVFDFRRNDVTVQLPDGGLEIFPGNITVREVRSRLKDRGHGTYDLIFRGALLSDDCDLGGMTGPRMIILCANPE